MRLHIRIRSLCINKRGHTAVICFQLRLYSVSMFRYPLHSPASACLLLWHVSKACVIRTSAGNRTKKKKKPQGQTQLRSLRSELPVSNKVTETNVRCSQRGMRSKKSNLPPILKLRGRWVHFHPSLPTSLIPLPTLGPYDHKEGVP